MGLQVRLERIRPDVFYGHTGFEISLPPYTAWHVTPEALAELLSPNDMHRVRALSEGTGIMMELQARLVE